MRTTSRGLRFGAALGALLLGCGANTPTPSEPEPTPTASASATPVVAPSATTAPLAEDAFVRRTRAGDRPAMGDDADCKASSADAIARALPTFGNLAKQDAARCLAKLPGGGAVLFSMVTEADLTVRATAVNELAKLSEPALADRVLGAIPKTEDPHARGKLYLFLGRSLAPTKLDALRALASAEPGPATPWSVGSPRNEALVALVKLGGTPERATLVAEIEAAKDPDEVRWLADMLTEYLKDRSLAKPLAAWLTNTEWADTSHRPTFRVCDLAAWTARDLGIELPIDADGIRKYDPATLAKVRTLLKAVGP